jgi:hypothetical protein
MIPNEPSSNAETPLEQAGRMEARDRTADAETRKEEQEADLLVADIDAYIAQTDPASLDEAEKQLNAWEIPSNPRIPGGPSDRGELVAVFEAATEGEAAIVRGVLEAQGIPTTLDGLPTRILGNVFDVGEDRWGDILVPADFAEEARQILAAASASEEAVTEEETSIMESEG